MLAVAADPTPVSLGVTTILLNLFVLQTQVPVCIQQFPLKNTDPNNHWYIVSWIYRTDSRLAPSQWETSLQCNAVSHWLGANLESALDICRSSSCNISVMIFFYLFFFCQLSFSPDYLRSIMMSSPCGLSGGHLTTTSELMYQISRTSFTT